MKDSKHSASLVYISILGIVLLISVFLIFVFWNKDKASNDIEFINNSEHEESVAETINNSYPVGVDKLFINRDTYNSGRVSRIASSGKNMNAVMIVPGEDFLLNPKKESVEDVYEQIDSTINGIVKSGFNTVMVDLRYSNSMIYKTEYFDPIKEADFMDYIEQKARENNLYIYVLYELFLDNHEGTVRNIKTLDNDANKHIESALSSFISNRAIDGVILTNYNNSGNAESFSHYAKNGSTMGYDNYLKEVTESAIKNAIDIIHNVNDTIDVGIAVDPIWANTNTDEKGIDSLSNYEQLIDGHADTKKIIENGYVDFVIVDTVSANSKIFDEDVVKWWTDVAKAKDISIIVMQQSEDSIDNAIEKIKVSKSSDSYKGTIFSSFKKLMDQNAGDISPIISELGEKVVASSPSTVEEENEEIDPVEPDTVSDAIPDEKLTNSKLTDEDLKKLVDAFQETPISNELKITNLDSLVFSTEEPSVIIQGSSDPKEKLYVNDGEIERDKNGYFIYDAVLDVGKNIFKFKHKGTTLEVVVTKTIKILKEVTPVGSITVEGGSKLTITALSYEDSVVTAVLGSIEVKLQKTNTANEDVNKSSQFVKFVGEITIPEAKSSIQELGNVQINALWENQTETIKGASVVVNKKAVSKSASKGKLVQITATLAETFPTDVINDVSNSAYFPLPKGTIDHAVSDKITYTEGSKTFEYYNLASGNRVYAKDITILEDDSIGANNISSVSITNDGSYTYVSISNEWKASYKMSVSGGNVNISMMDTGSIPDSIPSLTSNPLFSSAVWSDKTLQLKMSSGAIYGVTPYYNNNTLVFQFTNPKSSSSGGGTVVVIDAGHGLNDPGAPGFYPGIDERELNQIVASKLVAKLQAQGITTLLVPDTSKTSLQGRLDYAISKNADIFVSVHHNTSPNAKASGVEAYYFSSQSKSLASSVSAAISKNTGFINRGGKHSTYYVTRHQHFPSILVECGFMTNQQEYNKLVDSSMQDQIAQGIFDGIIAYLNNSYITAPVGVETSD